MPIYFGSQLISEARVGTQLYDAYVGSQMVHGKAGLPTFTYSGDYEENTAAYYGLSGDYTVVAFLSTGTLTLSRNVNVDLFMVGAGNNGATPSSDAQYAGTGGKGGKCVTHTNIEVGGTIEVTVAIGKTTTFGEYTAAKGGGAAGGKGGTRGSDTTSATGKQGAIGTRCFNEGDYFGGAGSGGSTYDSQNDTMPSTRGVSGGGAGGRGGVYFNATAGGKGVANTGGGGGGGGLGAYTEGAGGTGAAGIVLMRIAQ